MASVGSPAVAERLEALYSNPRLREVGLLAAHLAQVQPSLFGCMVVSEIEAVEAPSMLVKWFKVDEQSDNATEPYARAGAQHLTT